MFSLPKIFNKKTPEYIPPIEILKSTSGVMKDDVYRVQMTLGCDDTGDIPKVKEAGKIIRKGSKEYQRMHNGLLVERGGYFGDWMEKIISNLYGHHEPQEEKVFHEILKRLSNKSTMIELGSFWGYYSMWFNIAIKDGINICAEPDPDNLSLGERNARINNIKMNFINSAAGREDGKIITFYTQQTQPRPVRVPIRSADSLVEEFKLDKLDLLHMDVQGVELEALYGAEDLIKKNKLRFVFVSTHHYLISNSTNIHRKCLEFLISKGAHIVAEHDVHESFSGDGLIVASFYDEDKDFKVEISTNRSSRSLFRDPVEDINVLVEYIQSKLLKR